MIASILSRLNDLCDARQLARTVRVQAEQIADLQAQLEVAETAAEEYRGRLHRTANGDPLRRAALAVLGNAIPYRNGPHPTHGLASIVSDASIGALRAAVHGEEPPRDAQTLENRVLSLCEGWRADRERDTAARLTAAEVELAGLRVKNEEQRAALAGVAVRGHAAHEALTRAGIGHPREALADRIDLLVTQRRHAEQGWSQASVNGAGVVRRLTEALDARDEAQDRARRWERHARALARAARWMRSALLDCDDVTLSDLRAMSRGAKARLVRIEADRDTRDDAPPPTQPSERRAAAPPSPPRFRTAVVGGDR